MQFLPSTWARWQSDGDGDGVADPDDLTTRRSPPPATCARAAATSPSGAGWHAAVLSYNHDDAYVALVLATADAYATAAGG